MWMGGRGGALGGGGAEHGGPARSVLHFDLIHQLVLCEGPWPLAQVPLGQGGLVVPCVEVWDKGRVCDEVGVVCNV